LGEGGGHVGWRHNALFGRRDFKKGKNRAPAKKARGVSQSATPRRGKTSWTRRKRLGKQRCGIHRGGVKVKGGNRGGGKNSTKPRQRGVGVGGGFRRDTGGCSSVRSIWNGRESYTGRPEGEALIPLSASPETVCSGRRKAKGSGPCNAIR